MLLATLFNGCNSYIHTRLGRKKGLKFWCRRIVLDWAGSAVIKMMYMIKIDAENLGSYPGFVEVCKGFWVSGIKFCDHFHIQNLEFPIKCAFEYCHAQYFLFPLLLYIWWWTKRDQFHQKKLMKALYNSSSRLTAANMDILVQKLYFWKKSWWRRCTTQHQGWPQPIWLC